MPIASKLHIEVLRISESFAQQLLKIDAKPFQPSLEIQHQLVSLRPRSRRNWPAKFQRLFLSPLSPPFAICMARQHSMARGWKNYHKKKKNQNMLGSIKTTTRSLPRKSKAGVKIQTQVMEIGRQTLGEGPKIQAASPKRGRPWLMLSPRKSVSQFEAHLFSLGFSASLNNCSTSNKSKRDGGSMASRRGTSLVGSSEGFKRVGQKFAAR